MTLRGGVGRRRLATAVGAVALAYSVAPAVTNAGTYMVRQCDAAGAGLNPAALDATPVLDAAYAVRDRCSREQEALTVESVEPAGDGRFGAWRYSAPAGTEFTAVDIEARLTRDARHAPAVYMSGSGGGGVELIVQGNTEGWRRYAWTAEKVDGRSILGARLRCEAGGQPTCTESADAGTRIRDLRLTLNDTAAPEVLIDGPLLGSGWRRGMQSLAVSAGDDGGGVRRIEVEVNGATAAERVFDCATVPGQQQATRLSPCASDEVASFDLDTASAPFREGQNTVEVCAEDYGAGAVNRTCQSRTVRVDNVAPAAPINLYVVGGDDWRATNSFDIEWENPEQPAGASAIDGAWYRIENESGEVVEGPAFVQEPPFDSVAARQVDAPGSYTLRLWLQDAAGNVNAASAGTGQLRFDDQAPGPPYAPAPAGWLSRRELMSTYKQTWQPPASTPVSGLDGYAVTADSFPNTNPCETAANPDPAVCAGAEITHPVGTPRELSLASIPEGSSWIHIAAASGAGLRSTSVTHVEIRADRTDPATQLLGAPSGWTNQPPTLIARATDALSGMQPSPDDEGQPRTAMQVGDGPVLSDPDNEVVHVLTEEGDHQVRYWARDLAGNENDGDPGGDGLPPNGQPGVARVRLDMTAPQLAFTNSQDPADPELVRAPVTDSLSGLADGEISYRPQGGSTWIPLATEHVAGALEARLPSETLADGPYELRAEALDVAGNEATTTQRQDGTEMVLEVPLKVETELRADLGGGRDSATVKYGRQSRVDGRLLDAAGDPLGGQSIAITETFDLGSTESERTREAITDGDGRFAIVLPPGPSREVQAEFAGSRSLTDASSPDLDLGVRGDASLGSTEKRPEVGEGFRFQGRVRRAGAELPAGGKLVELQVRRPEGWDTVRQAFRTKPSGRWRFPFRFGPYYTRPTSFKFRLKLPRETAWPYKQSTTRDRKVTVVPRN